MSHTLSRSEFLQMSIAGFGALACGLPLRVLAGESEPAVTNDPLVNIMIASDMHVISPKLTDHGAYFEALITSADGKVTEYGMSLWMRLQSL